MTGGVGTALGAAMDKVAEGEGDLEEAVQAGLFAELDATETGDMDAPSPLSAAIPAAKRGGGRRPGSRNRRTEAVTSWLLSQHRHPLSVMMEAYSMTPAQLAAKIGLREVVLSAKGEAEEKGYADDTLLEVLKLQLRMAEAVAPYVAQRQPQAVQVDAKGQVTLAFSGVHLPARAGVAGVSDVIEGTAMSVQLPFKSDGPSRTDTQPTDIDDDFG